MLSLVYLGFVAAAVPSSDSPALCQYSAGHAPTDLLRVPMSAEPLPRLFSTGDYPSDAVKNRWLGGVVADLAIDREGRVSKCTVFQSSGHKVLDEKTCEVLKERARFTPAQDSNGDPVEGRCRTTSFNWKI